jgi:hypothetical protein
MLENLGFTPYEQRLVPWIVALGVLAMMLCFSIFDYVDRNPSAVRSFSVAEASHEALPSPPEALRRLRQR